jgi:hypothetical protein
LLAAAGVSVVASAADGFGVVVVELVWSGVWAVEPDESGALAVGLAGAGEPDEWLGWWAGLRVFPGECRG